MNENEKKMVMVNYSEVFFWGATFTLKTKLFNNRSLPDDFDQFEDQFACSAEPIWDESLA